MNMPVHWRGSVRNLRGIPNRETFGVLVIGLRLVDFISSILPYSNEVRSTFNLWSTLLAETRKVSRERASLAEVMASEMIARLEVMVKDVQGLTKKVCSWYRHLD